MLASDVYDAFLLVPLYLGMYFKEDLYIHGCVSKRLYKNVMNYLQRILCDFSEGLSRINVHVDGFKAADGKPEIIGTGLSCGVDSLSTLYDRYVNEDDPDYRISALFFFNTGWQGDYYNEGTKKLCIARYNMNKPAADELGLPFYLVDSNFHAFMFRFRTGGHLASMGYFANYSCVFGLQRAVKMYYTSSCLSYYQILEAGEKYRNRDICEFSESFLVPLIKTEQLEIVIDGCQYERSIKTERISNWNIARKYLMPCSLWSSSTDDAHNCSICWKCLRTLIAIEAMGKLEEFSRVFDIDAYRKHSFAYKCDIVLNRNTRDVHKLDNYNFALKHGLKMPSYLTARLYFLSRRALNLTKRITRKIIGKRLYEAVKKIIKH